MSWSRSKYVPVKKCPGPGQKMSWSRWKKCPGEKMSRWKNVPVKKCPGPGQNMFLSKKCPGENNVPVKKCPRENNVPVKMCPREKMPRWKNVPVKITNYLIKGRAVKAVTEQIGSGSCNFWRLETDRMRDSRTLVPRLWQKEIDTWNNVKSIMRIENHTPISKS